MPTTPFYLEHFLYNLYYVEDVREATILGRPFSADFFKLYHSGQEIASMMEALDWAVQHRDYDFKNMQIVQVLELTFSNEEILQSLETLREKLQEAFDQQTIDALSVPEDSRQLNVLTAEDSSLHYGDVGMHFTKTPYAVTAVYKKNDVFDKLAEEKFDILILSLHKDETIIPSLLRKIRDFEKQRQILSIPVLILLADPEPSLIEEIQQEDNVVCLAHPVWHSTLIRKIHELTS